MGKRLKPRIQADHVERIGNASPLDAVEELIYNAFDEKATSVEVILKHGELRWWDRLQRV